MKNNKVIGIIAITINILAFLYKGMQGARAGWEMLLPVVAVGLVLTIATVIKGRNTIAWLAIITALLSVAIFFMG